MFEEKVRKHLELAKGSDLSRDEDLAIGVMNLVSLEEHFFFTAVKTGNGYYLDLLDETRQMRKELMAKLVKDPKGEEWCASKHLLAASMRLMEVGTKELQEGKRKEAENLFEKSFQLFSLFFALNASGMVEVKEMQDPEALAKKTGLMREFTQAVQKLVDCCKE